MHDPPSSMLCTYNFTAMRTSYKYIRLLESASREDGHFRVSVLEWPAQSSKGLQVRMKLLEQRERNLVLETKIRKGQRRYQKPQVKGAKRGSARLDKGSEGDGGVIRRSRRLM